MINWTALTFWHELLMAVILLLAITGAITFVYLFKYIKDIAEQDEDIEYDYDPRDDDVY